MRDYDPRMERAAIYARLSRDPEGDKAAIARQVRDCRAYAQARGWTIAETFEDRDVSAFRDVERPRYEAMLDAIRVGEIDGILVWKLDRLVRSPREFERFWEVCEDAGATLASVNDPVDTSSELGMVVTRMLVGFARMESVNISTRTKSAQEERARAGRHHGGGQRPYGWRRIKHETGPMTIEVMAEEAEHIREAVERVLAGASMRSLAADWDARGILSPNGRAWSGGTLRSMLLSPRLAGQRTHNGEVVGTGEIPVIVDQAKHAELVALLTDPARNSGRRGQHYLLAGRIRCSCGAPMLTHVLRSGYRRYRCVKKPTGGCGKVYVKAEPIEAYVTEAVLAALPSIAARPTKEAPPADLDQLDRDQKNLERLALDYYTEKITRAEFFAARRALEERIKAARARLATRRGARVVDATVAERWPALSFDDRRAVLEAVLEAVVIHPASVRGRKAFEPERATFTWRA
jgi:site-specific DNA recombinase